MDSVNTSNVTDDQELAKVLENMNQQVGGVPALPTQDDTQAVTPSSEDAPVDGMAFEETPATAGVGEENSAEPTPVVPAPILDEPVAAPAPAASPSPELESIKKTALEELRPLVDKLDLPADEKFDTLLLLIRSTDDKSLVSAAHEAARAITDETKRAQALLDVIKEIDYFSGHGANPAL
jgi:hypothetical protein